MVREDVHPALFTLEINGALVKWEKETKQNYKRIVILDFNEFML